MKIFISGWAGFKEALGDIPEDWYFINPFLDFDEEGILDFLKDKSGEIIIGWSTGGHIVLKNLSFFSKRFKKIIIVAGFKRFTDYVHPRILKAMIKKLEIEPETVIKDFLTNAGCKPLLPEKINKEAMINGLKFLMNSDISHKEHSNNRKIIMLHGKSDIILPYKALFDLKKFFPESGIYLIEGSHWIPFKKILGII